MTVRDTAINNDKTNAKCFKFRQSYRYVFDVVLIFRHPGATVYHIILKRIKYFPFSGSNWIDHVLARYTYFDCPGHELFIKALTGVAYFQLNTSILEN